jgi:cell division protease FtsH
VHKVTVVPRGRSLGATHYLPTEEAFMTAAKSELLDRLAMGLGGRAAEKLIYNETAVGAESDLERATATARRMVMSWGMSDRIGPVSYKIADEDPFLGREVHRGREYSEATLEAIDEEVSRILNEASDRAYNLLSEHRQLLDKLTQELISKEELNQSEIEAVLGPPAQKTRSEKEGVVVAPDPAPVPAAAS